MPKLKAPLLFETAFSSYVADELIGEGGAGKVYAAKAGDGAAVAVKLLSEDRASKDKRSRFKNEIAFLEKNRHRNIVLVMDYGLLQSKPTSGPFYVMPKYDTNLRGLMREGIAPESVLPLFSQLLDGVEAAHLQGVVHRDLKPENVLYQRASRTLAIADFGIARFTEDQLATQVETAPAQRMANFQYAAPEQRVQGQLVNVPADMYALGLMLNELFTGVVPHGTDFKQIATVSPQHAYLDEAVVRLLRQTPKDRLASIAELKQLIQRNQSEAVILQRLSALSGEVVPATHVDDPLASEPPKLIGMDWDNGTLTLVLDRPVSREWIAALQNMGNYSSVMGCGPESFRIQGNKAVAHVSDHSVQNVVNHFKNWLPVATNVHRQRLEQAAQRAENQRRDELRRQKDAEERRLRILQNTKL